MRDAPCTLTTDEHYALSRALDALSLLFSAKPMPQMQKLEYIETLCVGLTQYRQSRPTMSCAHLLAGIALVRLHDQQWPYPVRLLEEALANYEQRRYDEEPQP